MRAIMVVPGANACQLAVEIVTACRRFLPQFPLDRSNEPLDASVLPGTPKLNTLLADVQQAEAESEQARDQHRFVVRPQKLWFAVAFHGLPEFVVQRPRGFVCDSLQP